MIDELRAWGLEPPVILGRRRLRRYHRVPWGSRSASSSTCWTSRAAPRAYAEDVQPERPPIRDRAAARAALSREAIFAEGARARRRQNAARAVTWREGSRGSMSSRFLALRVRPANIQLRNDARSRRASCPLLAARANGPRASRRAGQVLALQPARRHSDQDGWSGSRSCAGGSSTTTANSKTRSASTTSRAAPSTAGTTTSPSSPSPTRFLTLERLQRPPARAAA